MTRGGTYAAGSAGVAVVAAALAFAAGVGPGAAAGGYGWLGWGMMATAGIGSGTWLAVVHGRPGTAFLVALLAGILGRLLATLAGAAIAATGGKEGLFAFLAGVAAGFVPLQAYEIAFFVLAGRRGAGGDSSGG